MAVHVLRYICSFFFSRAMLFCLFFVFFAGGCSTDFEKMRREHAADFQEKYDEKTGKIVRTKPLGLKECIDIALVNNLQIKAGRINERIASLDRKIAFSNFLPEITFSYTRTGTDEPSVVESGPNATQFSDQHLDRTMVTVQQPIFLPQAWFMYSLRLKGEEISKLVTERTRQLIMLEVIINYYTCLSWESVEAYSNASVVEIETLLGEVKALVREGMVLPSRRKEVETLLQSRRHSLRRSRQSQKEAKAKLLAAMGLSPLHPLALRSERPLHIAEASLEELVIQAMLNRLELKIADRAMAVSKDRTKIVLAEFLPQIIGTGGFTHSSDSYLKYPDVWSYGLSAVLSVFDGFRTINAYKQAKEEEKKAFIEREQQCLSVMLEVQQAYHQYSIIDSLLAIAEKEYAAAEEKLREANALWREGLFTASKKLEALTRFERACVACRVAHYYRQVTIATLYNVLGTSTDEYKRENRNEKTE